MPIEVNKRNPVEVDETKPVEVTAVSDLEEGVVVITAGDTEIVLDVDAAEDLADQLDDAIQELERADFRSRIQRLREDEEDDEDDEEEEE